MTLIVHAQKRYKWNRIAQLGATSETWDQAAYARAQLTQNRGVLRGPTNILTLKQALLTGTAVLYNEYWQAYSQVLLISTIKKDFVTVTV